MNCANHPETPAVAYCQYCGKPLCAECVHKVNNIVSCEPCLAARVSASASGTTAGVPNPGATWSGQVSPGNVQPPTAWGVEPGIAIAIGWIPGVGAVYNGQIAKALIHVAIFAILIDLTHYNGLIGMLIPIWILYMWIEAYHTTKARRYGQPLPNPLGLNDIGSWFVAQRQGPNRDGWNATPGAGNPSASGSMPGNQAPGAPPSSAGGPGIDPSASGFASGFNAPPYAPYAPPVPPGPPTPPVPPEHYDSGNWWADNWWCSGRGRGIPAGAIILIVIGIGFLLANVGLLSGYWIDRGWPILIIALGVWLVVRRTQGPPPPPMPPAGGPR